MSASPNYIHVAMFYQREAALVAHHAINLLIFAQGAHDHNSRRGYEREAIGFQQKAERLYRLARYHLRLEVA
jgi:hypothetical protein